MSYGEIYKISKNDGLLNFKVNCQNNNSLARLGYKACSVCCKAFNFVSPNDRVVCRRIEIEEIQIHKHDYVWS